MSATLWTERSDLSAAAGASLKVAGQFWFVMAVAGQWIFAAYVSAFYGGSAIHGDLDTWNQALPHGFTPGDAPGNMVVAAHLFLVVVILVGGPLQLIPQVRRLAPRFHRWSGRLYIVSIFTISVTGLRMIWSRGASVVQYAGNTLHAVLIMSFAILAVRYAVAHDIRLHRRWALRLFMVVNAGLFFRIGLMQWLVLYRGQAGIDAATITGPFLSIWSLTNYLLPLAMLEIYLHARDAGSTRRRFATAAALLVVTLAMGAAFLTVTTVVWLPRVRAVRNNRSSIESVPQETLLSRIVRGVIK